MTRNVIRALWSLRTALSIALCLVVGSAGSTKALEHIEPLGTPSGPVVLSVTGKVQNTNSYGLADFDMAMLQALPSTRIETSTPWTTGVTQFDGVALDIVLRQVAAKGTRGEFTALNDYTARIDLNDAVKHSALIAYKLNGEAMSIRNRGPLWLIFPIDDDPELQTAFYRDRMIWQLRSINIK